MLHEESPQRCAVCGGPVTAIELTKDDASKPSRNLDVWNRSGCGNLLFGPEAVICLRDGYAYSPGMKKWGLSLENPVGFALKLDPRIRQFPVPEKNAIRSRLVYSQEIAGGRVAHSVGFWCDTDQRYLEKVERYGKLAGASVTVERDKLPGQTHVSARVETIRERGGTGKPNEKDPP